MLSNVQIITGDDGLKWALAIGYADQPLLAAESHPNFKRIVDQWVNDDAEGFADLFDIPKAVSAGFSRLSERVTVKDGRIFFDGDEVNSLLVDQILDFMDNGEDFAPLVNFFEKLHTNPLGDVREGLFAWIVGQKEHGNLTITPEGNVLGYKSMDSREPEWREGQDVVYVPSRRGEGIVNGREVGSDEYIEQVPGDVVEMPRSRVLHEPSRMCGDGLHIGTFNYAQGFSGDTVMLVEFSPRDIVSLPDSSASWKLRVCRYTVIEPVDEPLEVPVYETAKANLPEPTVEPFDLSDEYDEWDDPDLDLDITFRVGDRVSDPDGDTGTIKSGNDEDGYVIDYDDGAVNDLYDDGAVNDLGFNWDVDDLTLLDESRASATPGASASSYRTHGRGGPTSSQAKGRGRNPAQDPKTGQFVAGRPASQRDPKTGRFAG